MSLALLRKLRITETRVILSARLTRTGGDKSSSAAGLSRPALTGRAAETAAGRDLTSSSPRLDTPRSSLRQLLISLEQLESLALCFT